MLAHVDTPFRCPAWRPTTHRQQNAAVAALIPLVMRSSVVILFADTKTDKEAAPVVADGLTVIGAVAEALSLVQPFTGFRKGDPSTP